MCCVGVIEEARDANGSTLKALTVLSPERDPYRLDTPVGHQLGAWVAEQFEHVRKPQIHLRGLHYSIVARGRVRKPTGEVYVNTEQDWDGCRRARPSRRGGSAM